MVVLDPHRNGGRARTTERDGFVFNLGGHALYAGGVGVGVLRDLGVRPQGTPPPLGSYKVLVDGELHAMPSGPGSLLRTGALSARSKVQLSKLLVTLPRLDAAAHAGTSVEEWLATHDLRDDAARVVRALARIGTYASDFALLSAEAAISQLQLAVKSGVLYLDGGWRQLIDGLAAQVEVRRQAVRSISPEGRFVEVATDEGTLRARAVVVAAGTPAAVTALLPAGAADAFADVGEPLYAACLDTASRRAPDPGYVLGVDEPLYATTQSPPARQAPPGAAVVAVLRYGTRSAELDRPALEAHRAVAGVREDDVVFDRFLARMVVTGAIPLARNGGFRGRPSVRVPDLPGVFVAGDWVGPEGLLADASLASGRAAGRAAVQSLARSSSLVA